MDALSGRTVLVTGANGFIGRHLTARLARAGARVYALVRRPETALPEGVTPIVADLATIRPGVWAAQGLAHCDTVFHLAAFTPKNAGEAAHRAANLTANISGTHNLLESLPPVQRFIFASTLDVYAPLADGEILDEAAPVRPATLYGSAKLYAEDLVRSWAQETGVGWAILRYGHIFGPGEEAYRKLIPQTILRLQRGESPVIYGDKNALRDFLDVRDAVEATLRAAHSTLPQLGPVNIVRGESVTIEAVVRLLARLAGFVGPLEYLPSGTPSRSFRFDNSLMNKLLGGWEKIPLAAGLEWESEYMRAPAVHRAGPPSK